MRLRLLVGALVTAAVLAAAVPARAQAPHSRWEAAIDATRGPGAPTERKLEIFDAFWTTIDEHFAAFQGLDVDWNALRDRYRPEIAAGVSEGRFAGIMSHLALSLRELHTYATDSVVAGTLRVAGVPSMVVAHTSVARLGACATALRDGSALVYAVAPGNLLGLQPGDRILGYDGRPWRALEHQLLAAELPLAVSASGSSPSAFQRILDESVIANWMLFDTMDVYKHDSRTVVHLSTASLSTAPTVPSPLCTDGLPIAGVPEPQSVSDLVTWGVVTGTRIGYVHVTAWTGDAGDRFTQAIQQLTQDPQHPTDGLIIDFRYNRGGNMFLSDAGLGILFPRPVATIAFAKRSDPRNHFRLRLDTDYDQDQCGVHWHGAIPALYVIDNCDLSIDPRSYLKPIAVLTGPAAGSSGDQVALRMTYHPTARLFGESTNGAFNGPCPLTADPGWSMQYACDDAFRVTNPFDYLTHDELPVDEPVWLRPDDVAQGKDTVADAAIRWITSCARHPHDPPMPSLS
jgi:hypothetical protein